MPLQHEEHPTAVTGGYSWAMPVDHENEQPIAGPSAPLPDFMVRARERLARRQRRGGPGRRQRRRAREFGAVREGPDGELIYYDPLDENVDIPLNDSSEEDLQDAFRR